jgi:hypothetical protein
VKQKHINARLIPEKRWTELFPNNNQKKIAAVLIAKSLHPETSDRQFDGTLVFAKT